MKKILVTGATGFAGSFLLEHLVSMGDMQVYGTSSSGSFPLHLEHLREKIEIIPLDLLDQEKTKTTIAEIRPDEVYHLAALASPTKSFSNPITTITNNIAIEANLLEAIKEAQLTKTRVLITSSAEVYGLVAGEDLPIDENTPLRPTSPYAVSKIAQDFLGLQVYLASKVHVIRVRPFNHIGPRQTPQFVVARFASQIADIEKGKIEPILKVGNLEAKRDFTDVRDMVRAYTLLVEKGQPGEVYNIGTGTSHTIADILQKLLSLSSVSVNVETDPEFNRPADNPDLVCDASKMKQATGWEPTFSLEQTLKDTLDYWRSIQ